MTTTLTADLGALLAAVTTASRAIEARGTIPILANFRVMQGDNGCPVLIGTDLDIELTADIKGGHMTGKPFTIPAAELKKVLAGEDKSRLVTIIATPDTKKTYAAADVCVGDMTVTLPTLPEIDFPIMVKVDNLTAPWAIPGATFKTMAKMTLHSVSTESARYYLNGVRFGPDDLGGTGKGVAVSTDGHRLTHFTLDAIWTGNDPDGIIVPFKTMLIAEALTTGKGDEVITFQTQSKDATRVIITGDGWRMASKVIDGTFPDYTRVIPRTSLITDATWDGAEIKAAATKVVKLANDRSAGARVDFANNTMTRREHDGKTIKMTLRKGRIDGAAPAFGISAHYLADIAGAAGLVSDGLRFRTSKHEGDPIRIEPTGRDDVLFVLMPMRT